MISGDSEPYFCQVCRKYLFFLQNYQFNEIKKIGERALWRIGNSVFLTLRRFCWIWCHCSVVWVSLTDVYCIFYQKDVCRSVFIVYSIWVTDLLIWRTFDNFPSILIYSNRWAFLVFFIVKDGDRCPCSAVFEVVYVSKISLITPTISLYVSYVEKLLNKFELSNHKLCVERF